LPKETDVSFKSKWRAVIDFRKLNEWAVGYAYPVPNINYISDYLGKAEYFPSVDQVQLAEKSARKVNLECPRFILNSFLFQWA